MSAAATASNAATRRRLRSIKTTLRGLTEAHQAAAHDADIQFLWDNSTNREWRHFLVADDGPLEPVRHYLSVKWEMGLAYPAHLLIVDPVERERQSLLILYREHVARMPHEPRWATVLARLEQPATTMDELIGRTMSSTI